MAALANPAPDGWKSEHPSDTASRLLESAGIAQTDIDQLFAGSACRGQPGTRAYIKKGIDGMRRFMSKWETQLKNTKLP